MLLRTHIICFNFDKQPWKQNEICLQATNTACLIHDLSIELQRIRFGDSIPSEVDLLQVKDILNSSWSRIFMFKRSGSAAKCRFGMSA